MDIESEYKIWIKNTQTILESFPKAKNGYPYLRIRNGKRVFFRLFLKKYKLGKIHNKRYHKMYTKKDMIGRMKLIPIFAQFFRYAKIIEHDTQNDRRILEGFGIKAILVKSSKHKKTKATYELLSFYHNKKSAIKHIDG